MGKEVQPGFFGFDTKWSVGEKGGGYWEEVLLSNWLRTFVCRDSGLGKIVKRQQKWPRTECMFLRDDNFEYPVYSFNEQVWDFSFPNSYEDW